MRNKVILFKDYKFGMAIENNNVTDYVVNYPAALSDVIDRENR